MDPRRGRGEGPHERRPAGGAPRAARGGAAGAPAWPARDPGPMSRELEGLGDWRRSHTCGQLTRGEAGTEATLMGWVHRARDHGGVLFVDLRDRHGITQVVFRPEVGGAEVLERAARLGNEWVIAARGRVTLRPAESVNPELPTGEVELEVHELKVLAA